MLLIFSSLRSTTSHHEIAAGPRILEWSPPPAPPQRRGGKAVQPAKKQLDQLGEDSRRDLEKFISIKLHNSDYLVPEGKVGPSIGLWSPYQRSVLH